MKNKGFTLVELLAVIVILGIIAVITIPKINEQVESSKSKAVKSSALSYKKTIDEYILHKQMNKDEITLNGTYTVTNQGKLTQNTTTINITFDGEKPKGGSLTYSNNELVEGCITMNKYKVEFENGEFKSIIKGSCN